MSMPTAWQIFSDPDSYIGKEVSPSWDQRGKLVSVEQTNPYGSSKIRLFIEEEYGNKTFVVERDFNEGVTVRD